MDLLVSIIIFPFVHWQLMIGIIVAVIIWIAYSPILESDKLEAHKRKLEVQAMRNNELAKIKAQESHNKYPENDSEFSLKNFLDTYEYDSKDLSAAGFLSRINKEDLTTSDNRILNQAVKANDKTDFYKSSNLNAFINADCRELQLIGYQTLMSNYFWGSNGYLKDYGKVYEIASRISNFSRDAQFLLGELYLNGFFVEKNYKKAKELLIAAAIQGDAEANISLYKIYSEGLDVEVNKPFASACLNIAVYLRPKKTEWKDRRDDFSASLSSDEINLAQKISNELIDSNYRNLLDFISLD